jgi:hypothetical protein
MAARLLEVSKAIDKRQWFHNTPLRQFADIAPDIIRKLEESHTTYGSRSVPARRCGDVGRALCAAHCAGWKRCETCTLRRLQRCCGCRRRDSAWRRASP